LRKSAVLALSRALEDECCAQADHPVLFASFQRERFYSASERRWVELSRTARSAVVFADFTAPAPTTHGPLQVCVPFDAPINREWVLVCDSADYPGCVVGWEPPGQARGRDDARRFETFWSLDPRVVRSAARICAHLSEQYSPVAPRPAGAASRPAAGGIGRPAASQWRARQDAGIPVRVGELSGATTWAGPAIGRRSTATSLGLPPCRRRRPEPRPAARRHRLFWLWLRCWR
jgi:DICT domain-containing protein